MAKKKLLQSLFYGAFTCVFFLLVITAVPQTRTSLTNWLSDHIYTNPTTLVLSTTTNKIKDSPEALTSMVCLDIDTIFGGNYTYSTADIFFTSPEASFEYELGPIGFTQGTSSAMLFTATNDTLNLTNLNSVSSYDIYIRNDCGTGGVSAWKGPFTFSLPCLLTAPFSEDFENYTSGQEGPAITGCFKSTRAIRPRWETEEADGTYKNSNNTGPFTDGSGNTTGRYVYFEVSSSNLGESDSIIVDVDVTPLTTPYLSFDYHMFGDHMGSLIIDYKSKGGVWQNLITFTGGQHSSGSDPWLTFSDTLFNTNDTIQIKFKGVVGNGIRGDIGLDNVVVEEAPCPPSTNLQVNSSGITNSTAPISWTSGGGLKQIVEWGLTGFIPNTGTQLGKASTTIGNYTITNLLPATYYDVYIIDSCAVGLSIPLGPLSFATSCPIFSAPFSEDFDGSTWTPGTGNRNTGFTIDPCWETNPDQFSSNTFAWGPRDIGPASNNGPNADNTGGNFIMVETSGSTTGDIATLITPSIDLSNLIVPALYFDQHRNSSSDYNIPTLDVAVTKDDGATWTTIYSINTTLQTSGNSLWVETYVNLDNYINDTVKVRFTQTRFGCCGDGAIDNVRIINGPLCADPLFPSTTNVTDSSVTLGWLGSSTSNNYKIWFGPQGFFQGSATIAGSGNRYLISNDTLQIDTLTSNTCYEFVVKNMCNNGDSSTYIGPITFCTPCVPITAPYTETFDNTSAPNVNACWSTINPSGSIVGTSTTRALSAPNSIELYYNTGASNEIMLISPFFSDFDNQKRIRFNVWDDDFTSDLIIGTMSDPSDASTFTSYTTITAAQMPDLAWQEIRVLFNNYNGTDKYVAFKHGNDNFFDRFYIDNFIYDVPTCSDPTNFTLNSRTINSVDLSWGSIGSTSWEVSYGYIGYSPNSAAGTKVLTTNNTNYLLSGLSAGSTYDVYVRSICGAGDTSLWVGPLSVYTSCSSALSGTYTIGNTGDYTSFAQVGAALGICGISGPVTFNVQPGYYNDHLHLQGILDVKRGISGVSATNTITFNGSGSDTLEWDGQGTQAAIWIDSVSYITINNMYIINDVATEGWGILLTDDSDHINITNNTIFMDTAGVQLRDKAPIVVSGATDNDLVSGASVDNLTITGNTLYGGYYSVAIYGNSSNRSNFSSTIDFNNNELYNYYLGGVSMRYYTNINFIGNTIKSTVSTNNEDGISLRDCDDYTIEQNYIYVQDVGIYVNDGNDNTPSNTKSNISNNMVTSLTSNGIYLDDFENTNVWHNTVVGKPALHINEQVDMNVQNNILSSTGDFAFLSDGVLNSTDVLNYNIYFVSSSTNAFEINGNSYLDLVAWKAANATYNTNSLEGDPLFVSSTDLHVYGTLANDVGNNILGITIDFDGDIRPTSGATSVDIGADEYTPVAGDFAILSAQFDKNSYCYSATETILIYAKNVLGFPSDLATTPLTANYSVTGPVNSSGTLTLNTGIVSVNDTILFTATNIDLSVPGIYTLNASINTNTDNNLSINDSLPLNQIQLRVDTILTTAPQTVTLNLGDTATLQARSPYFTGNTFHFTEIIHYRDAGDGKPLGGWPSYISSNVDEYVEITGIPGADLGGYTFEQWGSGTVAAGKVILPYGTILNANGMALLTMRVSATPSPGDYLYNGAGGNNYDWSSGDGQGIILKDSKGNIIDAVGYPSSSGGYSFPPQAGVPNTMWDGSTPGSASSSTGIRLEGADVNTANGWLVSSNTTRQDPNQLNNNVTVPSLISATGFSWILNGNQVATTASLDIYADSLSPGTHNYVGNFNSPCGLFTDTVRVIVPTCFEPRLNSFGANALNNNSVNVFWDTIGLGASTNYEVEYGTLGYTAGTGTIISVALNNNVNITSLTQNTCVDFYVRAVCSTTDFSSWVGPVRACPNTVPCDDFDAYATGSLSNQESALIIPFTGTSGNASFSSNRAQSGTNALHLTTTGSSGNSNAVAYFDDVTGDAWDINFSLFVETGTGAYYNIQQDYIPAGFTGVNYTGADIYFDGNGTATVTYATSPIIIAGTFSYTQNQWFDMKTVIDLLNDTIWIEYNGATTGIGWKYSDYNPSQTAQFNGVNFTTTRYSTGTYPINFYVDDFCLVQRGCLAPTTATIDNVDCDNIDVSFISSTGASIVQYGAIGFTLGNGTYSTVLNGATSYNVSGLSVGNDYDIYVANVCSNGDTSAFSGPLTISPAGTPPVASFTYVVNNFAVTFDGSASSGTNLTYNWGFGDGNTGSGINITHTYATGGNFNVTLSVSDICGTDDTTITANSISLDENVLNRSLELYPNPTNDLVHISFTVFASVDASISLTELSGREIWNKTVQLSENSYTGSIDLANLARGVYMIQIKSGELTTTKRIIKQ